MIEIIVVFIFILLLTVFLFDIEISCDTSKKYKEFIEELKLNTAKHKDFLEELNDYFKNTPKEKIASDWAKTAEWDKVGPTFSDFLSGICDINNKIETTKYDIEACMKDFNRLGEVNSDYPEGCINKDLSKSEVYHRGRLLGLEEAVMIVRKLFTKIK